MDESNDCNQANVMNSAVNIGTSDETAKYMHAVQPLSAQFLKTNYKRKDGQAKMLET